MWERMAGLVETGGPVVVILIGLSVVAVTVSVFKIFQFVQHRVGARRAAGEAVDLYRQGDMRKAARRVQDEKGVLAGIVATTLEERSHRGISEDAIREEIFRVAADRIEGLRSHLRILEVIASLAPLLGLFGTVLGMIAAFQQLETAGSNVNPAILSGGIWQALLTTAVGLAVAIPTVALLNFFERTLDRLAHDAENLILQLLAKRPSAASVRSREAA